MLSKKYRLVRIEIEELKSLKGKVLQGRFFGLIFQPKKGEKKFAIILSQKISKKSTVRNKTKRLFFQALQRQLANLPFGEFLFLAKKSVLEAKVEDLEKELAFFEEKLR